MNDDFWHERWAKNEIGFHLIDTNPFLIKHWSALQATISDSVFVPLCGKSNDLIWLSKRVKQVVGVELSQQAVEDFFSDNGFTPIIQKTEHFIEYRYNNITLLCGDFFKLTPTQLSCCHFIYDRASLIAFPADMRKAYVKKLRDLIPDEVRRLLITLEYPQHEMNGPPFSVPSTEVQQHFAQSFRVEELESEDILEKAKRFKDKGVTQMFSTFIY